MHGGAGDLHILMRPPVRESIRVEAWPATMMTVYLRFSEEGASALTQTGIRILGS